jgi:hypothetical protein
MISLRPDLFCFLAIAFGSIGHSRNVSAEQVSAAHSPDTSASAVRTPRPTADPANARLGASVQGSVNGEPASLRIWRRVGGIAAPSAVTGSAYSAFKLSNTQMSPVDAEAVLMKNGMTASAARANAPKFLRLLKSAPTKQVAVFVTASAATIALIEFVSPSNSTSPTLRSDTTADDPAVEKKSERPSWLQTYWKYLVGTGVGVLVVLLFMLGQKRGIMS